MVTMLYLCLFVCLTVVCSGEFISMNADTYGPYTAIWNYYGQCSGPKTHNLTTLTTQLVVEDNKYSGLMNFTFPAAAKIEEMKLIVYNIKGDRKSVLWNYKIDKPCQHFAVATILETQLGARNCIVKKGDYYCNVNFSESAYAYLGQTFFYGEFTFKLVVLSKKGNIACLIFNPVFSKKTV